MSERTHPLDHYVTYARINSCSDRVTRTASELHRQTVNRAQQRFEHQLAKSEREVKLAMNRRRDQASSPTEKLRATQYLEHLRATLNNDYEQLVQNKVDQAEKRMNERNEEERRVEKILTQRKLQEALEEARLQSEKLRLESVNQAIRERDVLCAEKMAAQKSLYTRLLQEQERRLRAEVTLRTNESAVLIDHMDMAELKGRLARVEYENRELKQLIVGLRSDLSTIFIQEPKYKNMVHIPNFLA